MKTGVDDSGARVPPPALFAEPWGVTEGSGRDALLWIVDEETGLQRVNHIDLTIPAPAEVIVPVPYTMLHNVKGSIKRGIKQLGLDGQLQVETRQRRLLIMKKYSRAAAP